MAPYASVRPTSPRCRQGDPGRDALERGVGGIQAVPRNTLSGDRFERRIRWGYWINSAGCSAGAGSLTHLAVLLFLEANGASALHVPYKGAGPALLDLVGGRLAFAMQGQTAVVPAVRIAVMCLPSSRHTSSALAWSHNGIR